MSFFPQKTNCNTIQFIILIPKLDRLAIKANIFICLVNMDVGNFNNMLENRIQQFVERVIYHDQMGFF
jgi:hypothetical protein